MKSAKYAVAMAKHGIEPREMLSARVKPRLIKALDALVPAMEKRRSELVEQALEEFIERHGAKPANRKDSK